MAQLLKCKACGEPQLWDADAKTLTLVSSYKAALEEIRGLCEDTEELSTAYTDEQVRAVDAAVTEARDIARAALQGAKT